MSDDVDIWEVKLSEIIEAFIAQSESLKENKIDLEVSTEFLLIAATLVEIKVKRLLPRPENVEIDEEFLQFEYRDLLLARLLECKTFKDVAQTFVTMMNRAALCAPKIMPVEEPFLTMAPDPLENTPASKLRDAYIRVFSAPEKPQVSVVHLHDSTISVKDAVKEIMGFLQKGQISSFKRMMDTAPSKLHIVVSFLAVLELYKQGIIDIEAGQSLSDINISLLSDKQGDEIEVNADDWGEDPTVQEMVSK